MPSLPHAFNHTDLNHHRRRFFAAGVSPVGLRARIDDRVTRLGVGCFGDGVFRFSSTSSSLASGSIVSNPPPPRAVSFNEQAKAKTASNFADEAIDIKVERRQTREG